MRKLSLLALILGVFGVAACRSDDGGGQVTPDSSMTGQDTKIQDIQNDAMASGTQVTIKGVVVTAIDTYGAKTGDFWIQEPEGGEFSGIHVFGAPLDQVAALQVGDVVDIKDAVKDEFVYQGTNGMGGFDPGFGITELKPVSGGMMTVTRTGASMVLQPTEVNALMIGGLTDYMARAAEWEKWEGVLVTVKNVRTQNADACVGSSCSDPTLHKFNITGDIVVESSLAAMPTPAVAKGDCLSSVTGVVDYFFDYLLLPRATAEIGTGGTGCATEDTQTLCGDGLDNDGNGFTDCADNACVVGSATCRSVTTISAIQTATTPPTGGVEIDGVYVTALQRVTGTQVPRSMYVQTNAAASANNGILIYGGNTADLSAFAVGDKVNIIGKVTEFNDSMNTGTGTLTEISLLSATKVNGNGNIMPVTGQTAATLSVDATGEPYESVLVTLTNVKLTTLADATYHVGQMTQAATTFKFDDDLYRIAEGTSGVALNTCFASITGVWSYQVYDNAWYFLPTGAGTTGGTCP